MAGVVVVGPVQHRVHALGHQHRANHQRHGQRNLRHRKNAAQLVAACAKRAAAACLQLVHQIHAQRFSRRRKSRHHAGQARQQQREPQRAAVDGNARPARHVMRDPLRHRPQRHLQIQAGKNHPAQRAKQRQQHILRQQLAQNPHAARAQRRAHGHFRPPRQPARHLQIRHIGANHQQHKQGGAHNQLVVHRRQVAVDDVQQRLHLRAPAAIAGRIRLCQPRCRFAQLILRLPHGDAFAQPPHHHVLVRRAVGHLLRSRHQRHKQVRRRWILHRLRHHAHHGVLALVQLNSPPQHRRVGGKAPRPEAVAQYRHRVFALRRLIGGKHTPHQRRSLKHIEEARRGARHIHVRGIARPGQAHGAHVVRRHLPK